MLRTLVLARLLLRGWVLLSWGLALLLFLVMSLGALLPPGDQIAFMSDRQSSPQVRPQWDIYLLDLSRRVIIPLTNDAAPQRYPAWSPDGKRIAFHMDADGNGPRGYDLYIMNADGSDIRPMGIADEDPIRDEAMVAWSPDGESVVFHRGIQYQTDFQLYIADTRTGDYYPITQGVGDAIHADWSPDGRRMAFSAQRPEALNPTGGGAQGYNRANIYVLDVDSSIVNPSLNERRMRRLTDDTQVSYFPSWSPDGSQIAFVAYRVGFGTEDIFVMNADGSDSRNLTQGRMAASTHPIWTPDGRIVFASNVAGPYNLYIMDADGGNLRQLTDNRGDDQAPDWRPRSRGS